jgi:asparagine synthase (glutamine-hydrolysing)
MCGIAGLIRWHDQPVFEHEIRSMCRMMVHRGPDEEGIYVKDGVALGMRRLSIIDLEGGQQPVFNEDRTVCVVFNGEIYNYQELHGQLVRSGHRFRTESDTETIVHLYEQYGAHCVDHLRGMFAFAIWDMRQKRIMLARDRLGIKPLFYAETDNGIAFASELKPLLALPDVDRTVNWQALSHLFTFLATPVSQSIINGVKKLESGCLAVAERGSSPRIERYWEVEFESDEISSEEELTEQLREVLADAVAAHEISDVPVGAFLSGGIDSSAVVATMAAAHPDRRIKTFSIGFAEDGYDELTHARKVAAAFGTDHHELVVRPDVVSIVEDLAWYLDEPFGDTSAIPTYMVSKLASEHVKVVLTGDGGDELFAGYDKYVVERREREYDRVPAAIRGMAGAIGDAMPEGMKGRRFLRHLALDGPRRYLDASTLFRIDEMEQLFQSSAFERISQFDPLGDRLSYLKDDRDWMAAAQYCDLKTYLPLDILTKVDRMTMAHSIEARPPLLDHRLVEFAAKIPARLRLRENTTKYLLKQAMRGVLPDDIIDRKKQGFAVPIARWFRGELFGFARDILLSDTCRQRGFFDVGYVERLLRLNQRGRDLDLHLWTILSFELWCRRFLDMPLEAPKVAA